MSRKKGICKNHPDRESSRRCYYCKEHICSTCQQTHEHHLFCGLTCYYSWKIDPVWNWLKSHRAYIFILLFIILSDIILYALLKTEKIETKIIQAVDSVATVDSSWIKMDTSRTGFNYALSIRLDVEGVEEPVLLWKNGKFIASQVASAGKLDFGNQFFSNGKNSFSLWKMDEQGRTTLLDSFTVHFSSARIDYFKKQISRVYTSEKHLALTFDGGSTNSTTLNILDTLKSRNLQCTMFLTGNFIRLYPQLVLRMVADGHELGNHSFSHPHLTYLELDGSSQSRDYVNRAFIHRQLLKTDSLFYSISGIHLAPLWRAPYGELNADILGWAAEAGYKHINWSMKGDSWDWVADTTSNLYRSAEEIYTHYIGLDEKQGLNGCILLMHLGSERKSDFPYISLGRIIDDLQERGYQFTRVSDLIRVE